MDHRAQIIAASKKPLIVRLTPTERRALLEAIRIGMEDGSLEAWGRGAQSAEKKLLGVSA